MYERTEDLRIEELRPLLPPAILVYEELPITKEAMHTVTEARREVADALRAAGIAVA